MIPPSLATASFLRLRVRLRFIAPARFHFLHGGVVHGLLARALGEHLPETVIPFCPESGRVAFAVGEPYQFGLTLVGEARSLVPRLAAGLGEVGGARAGGAGAPVTLGGNFVLESMEELPEVADSEIESAAAYAARLPAITLRFVSPLRLKLPNDGGFVGPDSFPAELFLERLAQRLGFLATGRYPHREELPAIPAGVVATPRSLLWIDLPLKGRPEARAGRPDRMTLGGVLGTVELAGLSPEWHRGLALGRFLHAGSSTGYGLGRYSIEETLPASAELFLPARSHLELAAEPAALEAALEHLRSRSDAAGGDGVTPEELADAGDPALEALSAELISGAYQPPPLQGFVLDRPDGKLRPLAVPTVRDRVAQRAAGQVLAAGIDTLLEDCSYAYRKGFSRAGAARAIQRAYEDGYRTVLDADIAAFFDSVDLDRLLGKLRALYPFEPLVELVDAWLHAPVWFDGKLLARDRGVPQGSPISPLLANLYLDEFDDKILGQGYRLVRFADDFVILARDLAEAQRAQVAAREALAGLGLELHPEKTKIRSLDDGLTYLGYLFCRSLVLEPPKDLASAVPLRADAVPAASWLAQVPFARLRQVVAGRESSGGEVEIIPLAAPRELAIAERRPLYVTRWDAALKVDGERLVVVREEGEGEEVPLAGLSHVVLVGRSRATVPALLALAKHLVPTYLLSPGGKLRAMVAPHAPDWTLWQSQASLAADDEAGVRFAREVVAAKLENAARLAVRLRWQRYSDLGEELRALAKEALNKTELSTLHGLEGKGAALTFGALAESLPTEWNFRGRVTRPPPDPVNAMLSYGYTLLHHHASTALVAAGLNPQIGLFHRSRGRHHALASDLQEEFRATVDALVWHLIRRKEASLEDFTDAEDGTGGVWLSAPLRRKFIERFEERWSTKLIPEEGAEPLAYWQILARQAGRIRLLVRGESVRYEPFRLLK